MTILHSGEIDTHDLFSALTDQERIALILEIVIDICESDTIERLRTELAKPEWDYQ